MRKTARITTAILALGLLVAGLPALAQPYGRGAGPGAGLGYGYGPGDGHRGGHGAMGMGWLVDELDLTADQRQQLFGIIDRNHNGELGELHQKMIEARRALGQVIRDPEAEEQQVQEAAAAISPLAEQIAVLRQRMTKEIHAILTEEQRARLQVLLEERDEDGPGPHNRPPRRSR